jgi:hypothetical protein
VAAGCGKLLTGRQTRACSDRHRAALNRQEREAARQAQEAARQLEAEGRGARNQEIRGHLEAALRRLEGA